MKEIVLIHGALGAASQFNALKEYLEKDFRVLVFEIPGHGSRSNEEVSFSIEYFSKEFGDWLVQNTKPPVTLFGYSMGGYIGLYLSLEKPTYFDHIITLGTKFKWSVEESLKEGGKLVPDTLEQKVPQYAEYLKTLHGNNWKKVVEKTAGLMQKLGANPLITPDTALGVQVKTTLMLGELDKMVTVEETQLIQGKIKDSQFVLLPGYVHPLEKLNAIDLAHTLNVLCKA